MEFEPEIDKSYLFSKDYKGDMYEAVYVRCKDGSGFIRGLMSGFIGFEGSPDCWRTALECLLEKGYILQKEVDRSYTPPRPPSFTPPDETYNGIDDLDVV